MPRRRSLAQQIRARLRDFIDTYVGSQYALERRCPGIGHSTVTGWFKARPTMPSATSIAELAKRANLNPNWLLLGEGPPLRGGAEGNILERYRDAVVAEVAAAEHLARDQVLAWVPFPDALLRAAVQQVHATLHSPAADSYGSTGNRRTLSGVRVIDTIRWRNPQDEGGSHASTR
jgi:hypothetical protein